MDQATPADQTLLRHIRERGEDANLDGGVRLCARGSHQKGVGAGYFALHVSTDFVRPLFRKNPAFIRLS